MKDIIDRLKAMEQRIAKLEGGGATGLSSTDQTIKGSHDRLDAILGAGVASWPFVLIGDFTHVATDNTPTTVLTITTTNETGDADGGSYVVWLFARVTAGSTTTTTAVAAKSHLATFAHINRNTGVQTNSVVTEIAETAVAANDAAARDIGTVTVTLTGTGETVTNVLYTVDVTGTSGGDAYVRVWAVLVWQSYTTAPVMTVAA